MTLIGGKQIRGKWAIFTDDWLTVWQKLISAVNYYRPKIREVNGGNVHLIIASCWSTKDIDYFINQIEHNLPSGEIYDACDLQEFLQDILYNATKDLKDIKESVECSLLILETNTNTLWATEEYSIFRVNPNTEIIFWSAEQGYHSLRERYPDRDFFYWFCEAVDSDEYCKSPVYVYHDNNITSILDLNLYEDKNDDNPGQDWNYWMTYGFTGWEAEVLW